MYKNQSHCWARWGLIEQKKNCVYARAIHTHTHTICQHVSGVPMHIFICLYPRIFSVFDLIFIQRHFRARNALSRYIIAIRRCFVFAQKTQFFSYSLFLALLYRKKKSREIVLHIVINFSSLPKETLFKSLRETCKKLLGGKKKYLSLGLFEF